MILFFLLLTPEVTTGPNPSNTVRPKHLWLSQRQKVPFQWSFLSFDPSACKLGFGACCLWDDITRGALKFDATELKEQDFTLTCCGSLSRKKASTHLEILGNKRRGGRVHHAYPFHWPHFHFPIFSLEPALQALFKNLSNSLLNALMLPDSTTIPTAGKWFPSNLFLLAWNQS